MALALFAFSASSQNRTVTGTITDSKGSPVANASVTVKKVTGILSGSATICDNDSATLSIAVTGTGPWSGTLDDGTAFSGASSPITKKVSPVSNHTYSIATLLDVGASCSAQSFDKTGSAAIIVNARPVVNVTGTVSDNSLYQGSIIIRNDATGAIVKDQYYEIHYIPSYNFSMTCPISVTASTDFTVSVKFEDHGHNLTAKTVKIKVNP